jgi:iron complex outermembrane receptor protein
MNTHLPDHLLRLRRLAPWIALVVVPVSALRAQSTVDPAKKEDVIVLEKFVADEKPFDPTGLVNNRPVNSAFGFDKTIAEAPKAISLISTQQMESVGIRVSDDLVKVAPSTYSNFRYGLQGNISIRNQTSDFYFRGMKRIDPQGNFRTIWGANDGLEIVRGPASPIFGLGRIGGYVNFIPKTARASTGKYLEKPSGSTRITLGAYDKQIATVDVAGPLDVKGHQAGYAIYGYIENSDSYFLNSFDRQKLLQTTFTMDITRDLRVETGAVYHKSHGGLPGGTNRTTNDQIATDTYWSGGFSYQLDENHDGQISERESRNAYFFGTAQLSTRTNDPARKTTGIGPSLYFFGQQNDPFYRRLPWQGGPVTGGTITMAQFKSGYSDTQAAALGFMDPTTNRPYQRMGYQLLVYPTISDGNTTGAPGQVPNKNAAKQAFWLPPTFDLAPDTWVRKPWNERMGFGEDYYRANIGTFFFDLVNDANPEWTIKNQILVDGHRQIKDGRNPFSQRQEVTSFEDKVTYSRRFSPKKWWQLDTLVSANTYSVWSYRGATNPTDIDFRRDLQLNDSSNVENTFTPNDTFYSVIQKGGYEGSPISAYTNSRTTVSGVGVLADQTFGEKLNVMTGFRYDYVDAFSKIEAGTYDKGGSSLPATYYVGGPSVPYLGSGLFVPETLEGRGNSSGPSMMINIGYKLPWGLRPYVQAGKQTVLINNASDQSVNVGTARNSLTGKSQILEAGIKGTMGKGGKFFFALAGYEQTRISFDPISTVGGAASSTLTRGFEYEIRWLATKHLSLATTGTWSYAHYLQGGVVSIDGRSAGYPDVVDGNGKILIPAEAFVWGGRVQTAIPDSDPRFRKVESLPATVSNATITYTFDGGYFLQTTLLHQGPQFVDRLQTLRIPQATTADLSFGIRVKRWELYTNIVNITGQKLYTRGVTERLISPKFAQNFDVTFARKF